ncbi:MAG: hypothetical protein ACOYXT_16155 [Bacteroidota bacterium]
MNKLLIFALFILSCLSAYAQTKQQPILLPSWFVNGERFYLKLATASGDTIQGFCDTGGGFTAIFSDAIQRANLQSKVKSIDGKMGYIDFTDAVLDQRIPPVAMGGGGRGPKTDKPYFLVPPNEMMQGEEGSFMKAIAPDAFLGQFFFLDKAWTFDYLKRQVWVNTPIAAKEANKRNVQKIGFKKDEQGKKIFGHPSMTIEVEGEILDMLFDTGATFRLTESSKKAFGTNEISAGGSFIAKSVFDQWRAKHPDWKIIEKADGPADMIEVPKVKIGNNIVGPVWFSMRPDEAWSKGMIQSMDKVVKGAVGGSAFKYLKVTIDYNTELAKFESR